ncbi:MAG: hypothetical protein WCQ21_32025, partial [Verrucomicrobiota bacterium]
MTPYLPELAPWIDLRLKALPADSAAAPQPCGEPPSDADLNPLRYMQRQIVRKAEALPAGFGNQQDWERYRHSVKRWLRRACVVDEMHLGEARSVGPTPAPPAPPPSGELTMEKMAIAQDEGLVLSVKVFKRASSGTGRQPAVVLSYADGQSATCAAVTNCVRALAEDGYLVVVPEHASTEAGSARQVASIVSLYGAGDTTGMSPMAMRVWDDLAALKVVRSRSDAGPIAVVGLGVGGIDAAIAAALDEEVAAVAAVGAITVRDWAEKVAPNGYQIMPYLPDIMATTDWQYVYSAALPRSLLIVDGTDRANWPAEAFIRVQRMAEQVASLQGASDNVTFRTAASTWGVEEIRDWLKRTLPRPKQAAGQSSARERTTPVGTNVAAKRHLPVFTTEEVAAYKPKGPTQCFRHLCYDYNWPGRTLADLPKKFTRSDPVELAEFSRKNNLDAVLLLAVPHHGYCTFPSSAGTPFPALQGKDWYGQCVKELHERNISVFGYITLGTNWKFMRDNLGKLYIHGSMNKDGVIDPMEALCLNAPGYIDLVEAYTRELLTMYPVDAVRYDMLFGPKKCLCEGCKAYYKELYGEELTTWDGKDSRRVMDFYLATLDRPVTRLTEVAREVKPSVEIWQNHINTYSEANVNLGRLHDVAYIEFGDPARLLALKGILNKDAIIVGQTLKSPIRRTIMALGARCYQYVPVNQETALPGFDADLARRGVTYQRRM